MKSFSADYHAAEIRPSPNIGERRGGVSPDLLILHYTGMNSGKAAEDWLCNPQSQVSCQYIVHEDGQIVQMVREADRAWHAGASAWFGRADVNSFSIGIEIVNCGHDAGCPPFPDGQIEQVIALSRDICARWQIAPQRVLGHSDVAPGRKIDPGEAFPWAELARHGVGHFVEPAPLRRGCVLSRGGSGEAVAQLQQDLAAYGYSVETSGMFDSQTVAVVEAFQRHFRPELIDGIADGSTLETLKNLHAALAGSSGDRR